MCLSTVYRGSKEPGNEVLRNVMLIESQDGVVTLTDIMGREEKVQGEVILADLTGGTVVVAPRA